MLIGSLFVVAGVVAVVAGTVDHAAKAAGALLGAGGGEWLGL